MSYEEAVAAVGSAEEDAAAEAAREIVLREAAEAPVAFPREADVAASAPEAAGGLDPNRWDGWEFDELGRATKRPGRAAMGPAAAKRYVCTAKGVEALQSMGQRAVREFGSTSAGAVLTEAQHALLEREGYRAEDLAESGVLAEVADGPAEGSGAMVEVD